MADLNLLPNISPKVGRLSGLLGVAPASLLTTELRRSSVDHHTSLMQPLLPASSTTTIRGAVSVRHSSHNEARIRNDFWQSNVCPCLNCSIWCQWEFSSMQCFGQTTISSQLSKWSGPLQKVKESKNVATCQLLCSAASRHKVMTMLMVWWYYQWLGFDESTNVRLMRVQEQHPDIIFAPQLYIDDVNNFFIFWMCKFKSWFIHKLMCRSFKELPLWAWMFESQKSEIGAYQLNTIGGGKISHEI